MGGLGKFVSENAGGLLMGAGQGLGAYMTQKSKEDENQRDRQYLIDRDARITDSYNVDPASLPGNGYKPPEPDVTRPTPTQKYTRRRYQYDSTAGRIVMMGG